MIRDMKTEDKLLKSLIDTCRLDYWHQAAFEAAQRHVAAETHAATEAGAVVNPASLELERVEQAIQHRAQDAVDDLVQARRIVGRR